MIQVDYAEGTYCKKCPYKFGSDDCARAAKLNSFIHDIAWNFGEQWDLGRPDLVSIPCPDLNELMFAESEVLDKGEIIAAQI